VLADFRMERQLLGEPLQHCSLLLWLCNFFCREAREIEWSEKAVSNREPSVVSRLLWNCSCINILLVFLDRLEFTVFALT